MACLQFLMMEIKCMKNYYVLFYGFILLALTACGGGGGGGSNNDPVDTGLSGLSECVAPNAQQAVVCGTVLANDGVTPLVNAEIILASSARAAARGVANDDKCLTDGAGDYVCVLPAGVTGSVDLTVILNGFDETTISADVTAGQITEAGSQTLTGNNNEKWVVVPGIFDGVQVLLAQLKGCTLTGPGGSAYNPATDDPDAARGSVDCENKGLKVLNDADVGAFLASSELLDSDSLFINCQANYSSTNNNSLLQEFVDQGGHVYSSDRSDTWLTDAFPGNINFAGRATSSGITLATAETAGLASVVGNSVNIEFDLGAWTAIDSVESNVTTFIESDITDISSYSGVKPITVGWKENTNSGCVFYTSYHIEGANQGSPQELAIKYLVQNISPVCQN